MAECLIGLGSNVGNRQALLDEAVARLGRHPAIRIDRRSSWLETRPVGGPPGQANYLNGAVLAAASLPPEALLTVLQEIETVLGRRREQRWGPRTIDLDLLLYDRLVLSTPTLTLPHPRMAWRRFVLEPSAQIAGQLVHPTIDWTVQQLLEHLDTTPPYVAITGSIGSGKSRLAREVVETDQPPAVRLVVEQIDLGQLDAFYADPARHGWQMEMEFLEQRTTLLAASRAAWADRRQAVVSDFWFDQSLAFARVWLAAEEFQKYVPVWEQARRQVVRPRLIVLLEASADELVGRVRSRGRPCERRLSGPQLERIGDRVREEATRPGQGPLLRLPSGDAQAACVEVRAALEAML
ncbi:MAG: 2-amino-4-hydroxy-6-hydroxymethyldihydropteridine diphosphokinase [Thermoguttaceae bacterium]|jgi:2-amino-4-hydroxy-6-hydroxymethyldihydropteridine diphosphokinase